MKAPQFNEFKNKKVFYKEITYEDIKKSCDRINNILKISSQNKKKFLEIYSWIEDNFENNPNRYLHVMVQKIKVEILIEFRDFSNWVLILHRLIDFCEKHKFFKEELAVLNQLGIVYRFQKKYKLSIQFHILQLELSWEHKDLSNEMNAYDNICLAYYMMKISQGSWDQDNSIVKKIAFSIINNRRDKLKFQGFLHLLEEFEK